VKVGAFSIAVFIVAVAGFLANLETIIGYFHAGQPVPSIPAIVVKLSNSSQEDVVVSRRGDFILWFPGPSGIILDQ
jgi:hypothetical protein